MCAARRNRRLPRPARRRQRPDSWRRHRVLSSFAMAQAQAEARSQSGAAENLLEVQDLVTEFRTEHGTVRAVDRVSFEVAPGQTLGVVGESGCGKSVTALSIMRLIPDPPGRIAGGAIRYRGQNLLELDDRAMRDIRGNKISMIFQEPMTSL